MVKKKMYDELDPIQQKFLASTLGSSKILHRNSMRMTLEMPRQSATFKITI